MVGGGVSFKLLSVIVDIGGEPGCSLVWVFNVVGVLGVDALKIVLLKFYRVEGWF